MGKAGSVTDNERYEKKLLAMIRETPVMPYWELDSLRLMAAAHRLENRGVIKWTVLGYPRWGFEILQEPEKTA
jgi:phosphoribosylaminoimidazole carboxylase (NCAIR synthetase)